MRRLLLLALMCMATVAVFAPAALAQDPCPDPDFPRFTPDGCQASDLPDVAVPGIPPSSPEPESAGASASATATASASAEADVDLNDLAGTEPVELAPGGPCATPEVAPDITGQPVAELPNAYQGELTPSIDPDGNGIACDDGGSASATAESDDEESATAAASASAEVEALPETGGVSPALLTVLPAWLLVGSGVLALRVVRRG